MRTYTDPFAYIRAATGLETTSLVGNLTRLSTNIAVGVTSLPVVPATTVDLKVHDQITLFDEDMSEVVLVTAATAAGASTIPVTATVNAHDALDILCSDGVLGSLSDAIARASNWIENICQQSLYLQSYTNETLCIPSMQAAFDNNNMLVFRPRHFPVLAETGLVIAANAMNAIAYDANQIMLDGGQQVVTVPFLSISGSTTSQGYGGITFARRPALRSAPMYLKISYTAGWLPLPGDITDAAIMLTSEIIGRRQNPLGSNQIRLGDKLIVATSSRDLVGESLLVKIVKQKLQQYSVEAF